MESDIINIAIVLGAIIGSMILHELAHGAVAYALGDDTAKESGRLTLNPIKHLDPFMSIILPVMLYIIGAPVFGGARPVPINSGNFKHRERDMALVGLAGPATNFLLALIAFLIGHYTGFLYASGYLGTFFLEFIFVNLGFMTFNLLPIPPLDGSRVLYAIAPDGVRNIMLSIEKYGIIIVYGLIFILGGAFSSLMRNAILGVFSFFFWIVGA